MQLDRIVERTRVERQTLATMKAAGFKMADESEIELPDEDQERDRFVEALHEPLGAAEERDRLRAALIAEVSS